MLRALTRTTRSTSMATMSSSNTILNSQLQTTQSTTIIKLFRSSRGHKSNNHKHPYNNNHLSLLNSSKGHNHLPDHKNHSRRELDPLLQNSSKGNLNRSKLRKTSRHPSSRGLPNLLHPKSSQGPRLHLHSSRSQPAALV